KEMVAKQRQDAKLEGAILAAIRRATELARKEAARKSAADKAAADRVAAANAAKANARPAEEEAAVAPATLSTMKNASKTVFASDADMHLTGDFEKNRGRLPWPVNGTVSMSFGRHEYIKGIWHDNAGVTIDVQTGAAVKAVFEGEVQAIMNIGDVQAVMIRHGKYFTTYSNLSTVSVTKGEHVGTGQIIGRVGEIGQLEFVLSDDRSRNLDPERWLKR
ncbi:MAG TPA: peptidoglycan DD-metalloendopeptidase family protein, partial [Puia sp.]|nr:peptidoglycan DD-metalloendopeptidase family protein [Puia sp.]